MRTIGIGGETGTLSPQFLARFSEVLLKLHRQARAAGDDDFHIWMFDQIKSLISFEYGWWGVGVIDLAPEPEIPGPLGFDVHFYHLPEAIMQAYNNSAGKVGAVARAASSAPGVTVNACLREWFPESVWPYFDQYGLQHELATHILDPETRLTTSVSIARSDRNNPFSEQERLIMQTLTPHLVDAYKQAKIAPWIEDSLPELRFPCVAIADRSGTIRHASDGFAAMLQKQWPEWSGPLLPQPLQKILVTGGDEQYTGAKIFVKIHHRIHMVLLRVRLLRPVDLLTPRQMQMALAAVSGLSSKEIARRFDVSPNTVRNHQINIYRRLNIKNKLQLAEMLTENEPVAQSMGGE